MQILHRLTNACLWEGEAESIKDAVEKAVANNIYLDHANLVGARLGGASLDHANLDGANLDHANLVGANLDHANLVGASLVGARLGGASLDHANLVGASLVGARLGGASLVGARLGGANLDHASLVGARLVGASLDGANLGGARLKIGEIKELRVFSGLYQYQIWAVVLEDGTPWVRMGCQFRSVREWDEITIRKSRVSEFPDDGSPCSEQRARAFEYAKVEAIEMAKLHQFIPDAKEA